MEAWLLFGILAYAAHGISTSLDKLLMNQRRLPLPTSTFKMFFDGLILLVIGIVFFSLHITTSLLLWASILGIIYAVAGVLYYTSLQKQDVEEVIPTLQSLSILFVFVGSVIFLSEQITIQHLVAAVIIILGVQLLMSKKMGLRFKKNIFLITILAVLHATYFILAKNVIGNQDPLSIATVMYFTSALVLFAYTIVRRKQAQLFDKKNFKVIPAAIFGALGTFLLLLALRDGVASKVYLLVGVQFLFIFIIATLFLKEKFSWRRLAGTIIIFSGLFLL